MFNVSVFTANAAGNNCSDDSGRRALGKCHVHMNATITDLVHRIESGVLQPTRERMNELADQTCEWDPCQQ